ncbi:MAG TPA: LacI family DNA-binding transcriptional regulator [Propionibacteriaceae bacterium]|nr:LacI family DNA-binding transcriptional regulator [Propionibacteriaceae bacterium]
MSETDGRARPARIKDVAALAGVSLKTVTNVVHERPYVREETRTRVRAAIEQLNYRPSLTGRRLRSGRSNMVTLAVPRIDEPYLGALAHAMIAAASKHGFAVLVDETAGRPERETAAASGYPGHGIDGVIYSPLAMDSELMAAMSHDTPMVLLGEPLRDSTADYVAIDNEESAREVVDHLAGQGRHQMAFLGGQPDLGPGVGELRAAAALKRLTELGLPGGRSQVINSGPFSREEGELRVKESLPILTAFDALICASDLLAIGAMAALRKEDVSVPDDLAVVGWDNIIDGQYHTPSLTSVAPDLDALADTTMKALMSRIEGDRSPSGNYRVPHRLVLRESSSSYR